MNDQAVGYFSCRRVNMSGRSAILCLYHLSAYGSTNISSLHSVSVLKFIVKSACFTCSSSDRKMNSTRVSQERYLPLQRRWKRHPSLNVWHSLSSPLP